MAVGNSWIAVVASVGVVISAHLAGPPPPGAVAATPATAPQAAWIAPGAKACVAIVESQVLADLPVGKRQALVALLDTLLTKSLGDQDGLDMVERQAIDRLLAERAMAAGGLIRLAAADVDEPVRPLWAAGTVVCSQIDRRGRALMIEAVSAQTGQLRASLAVPLTRRDEVGLQAVLADKLPAFWRQAREDIQSDRGGATRPLVEVVGPLPGKLTRLQWMVDDLAGAARTAVSLDRHIRLLVPRQPFSTKEERLLQVMGLTADPADESSARPALRVAPDARLTCELIDSAQAGVELDMTPITVKLNLVAGSDRPRAATFQGTVGRWEACRVQALKWLSVELPKLGSGPATSQPELDQALAAQMARQELDDVAQWPTTNLVVRTALPRPIQLSILDHALRAAHLDPTSEQAAFLAAVFVDALYGGEGAIRPLVCYDRVLAECARYISRFGKTVPDHHREVLYLTEVAAASAAAKVGGSRSSLPDARSFHYIRLEVRAMAEHGYLDAVAKTYATGNTIVGFGPRLVNQLIPLCPDTSLEVEYRYWKDFWSHKMAAAAENLRRGPNSSLVANFTPWELVEAAFAARRKDVSATRVALQRLAQVCPNDRATIWGGGISGEPIIPSLLNAAGDPDWQTWQPNFHVRDTALRMPELSAFMARLRPTFPEPMPADRLPVLPSQLLDLSNKDGKPGDDLLPSVRSLSGLLVAEGEIWLFRPSPPPSHGNIAAAPPPSVLYRATMATGKAGPIRLEPVPLAWPSREVDGHVGSKLQAVICGTLVQQVDGKIIVWIGTTTGLARFDQAAAGEWTSRWYTTRDGLPGDEVRKISVARLNGQDVLVVIGRIEKSAGGLSVAVLNPVNNKVTLLYDGTKGKVRSAETPAARLVDGRVVLVEYLASGPYGAVDLKDIAEFVSVGLSSSMALACVTPGGTNQPRLWCCSGSPSQLAEVSLNTAALGDTTFKVQFSSALPDPKAEELFHEFWPGDPQSPLCMSPCFSSNFMVGVGETVWMVACPSNLVFQRGMRIIGFQPAPPGAQNHTAHRWVGPFESPDGTSILSLQTAGVGKLLVTTEGASYLVSCDELIRTADKAGLIYTTDVITRRVEQALIKSGWQGRVPAMIADSNWQQALDLLDSTEQQLGAKPADPEEPVRLRLWRACALARMPDGRGKAIDQYAAMAGDPAACRPARALARINLICLLHEAGRFKEMLDLIDVARAAEDFPQQQWDSPLVRQRIEQARRKLAPQSQP